jgi:hypothetical protein
MAKAARSGKSSPRPRRSSQIPDPADPAGPRGGQRRGRGAEHPEHASDQRARTRGAQPGNLNALKHGFYAKHFRSDELAELAQATAANLNGEIGLTRVAARRVLALLDEAESAVEKVALLNAISMAAMRVASLLKTKKFLSGNGDDMSAALQEALRDVALETEYGRSP